MIPGTLWHVRAVGDRFTTGNVYIDAPRWFDARDYASRFFAVHRDDVDLVVVPDGAGLLLPCRVVRPGPNGTLIVSRRRAAAKVLNGAGAGGSHHE